MFRCLLCLCCVALAGTVARADALSEEVPVPGGTQALAQALGLDATPDRALFITELTRAIYDNAAAITDARLAALAAYLRSARADGPAETVPLPLSLTTWNKVILERPVGLDRLFGAVIADRRAALLAHGLASLDDETLRFMDERPALLSRLYQRDSAAFALFAGSLHVRQNAVILPGGAATTALWQHLVDETPASPERFIRQLFGREHGRVAYLYDAASRLDAPARAFMLGMAIPDPQQRATRLRALLKALAQFPGWTMPERSFRRPPNDPILMIMRVPVDAGGRPEGPSDQALWSRVFDRPGLEIGAIDAAWLAESILDAGLQSRRERIDQVAFGLRVFSAADTGSAGGRADVIASLRAFPRARMLLLSLERIGIRTPATYAAAVRQAARLSEFGGDDGFVALAQFQGSLALLVRLVMTDTLDARVAERLVMSLCAVPLDGDGRFGGGIVRWVQRELLPAIAIDSNDVDTGLTASLSGEASRTTVPPVLVHLENGIYRLDLAAPEKRRTERWLARFGAPPVSLALAVAAIADELPNSRAGARRAIDRVKTLIGDRPWEPRGGDDAARVASSIYELADEMLADALLAIAYALNMEAPESTFAGGNLSRRHDFGMTASTDDLRGRLSWMEPVEQIRAGVPWHVTGSLLGLDLGLARLGLRRISSDTLPGAPVLGDREKDVFTRTVAAMNAFHLTDADRDRIADAIARGRERVSTLIANAASLDGIADAIGLEGARRGAVRWTIAHDQPRLLSYFSLTELLVIGAREGDDPAGRARLNSWGVAADAYDGCLCTKLPPPGRAGLIIGRWPTETVATEVADLNLRVALALAEKNLPAALARGILAAATRDFVDRVRPLDPYDWLSLSRAAQALTTARIEDYVAALAADGPLVPALEEGEVTR